MGTKAKDQQETIYAKSDLLYQEVGDRKMCHSERTKKVGCYVMGEKPSPFFPYGKKVALFSSVWEKGHFVFVLTKKK